MDSYHCDGVVNYDHENEVYLTILSIFEGNCRISSTGQGYSSDESIESARNAMKNKLYESLVVEDIDIQVRHETLISKLVKSDPRLDQALTSPREPDDVDIDGDSSSAYSLDEQKYWFSLSGEEKKLFLDAQLNWWVLQRGGFSEN